MASLSALWNYTVGDSMANGSSRITLGWLLAIMFFGISVLMFATISSEDTSVGRDSDGDGVDDGCDEDPFDPWYDTDQCEYGRDTSIEAGSCCCVLGILSLLIVQSGTKAKKKTPQLIYIPQAQQPAPQQVIHHHTTHTYAPQPVQTPVQPIVNPNSAPIQQAIQDIKQAVTGSSGVKDWNQEAQNLELARDWEGAAEAYQKAGMYAEAGRVRQMHLENNDPQVKIDIAQLGDKIQDSVVMKDGQSQNDDHQV